jgi:hypothetical protein
MTCQAVTRFPASIPVEGIIQCLAQVVNALNAASIPFCPFAFLVRLTFVGPDLPIENAQCRVSSRQATSIADLVKGGCDVPTKVLIYASFCYVAPSQIPQHKVEYSNGHEHSALSSVAILV